MPANSAVSDVVSIVDDHWYSTACPLQIQDLMIGIIVVQI